MRAGRGFLGKHDFPKVAEALCSADTLFPNKSGLLEPRTFEVACSSVL